MYDQYSIARMYSFCNLSRTCIFKKITLLDWGATIVFIGGIRGLSRMIHERYRPLFTKRTRVRALIVGANETGEILMRAITKTDMNYQIVGFIDQQVHRFGRTISGVPVMGPLEDISSIAIRLKAQEILIINGKLPGKTVRALVNECTDLGITIRVIPSYEQIIHGRVSVKARDVSIEDLLGRDPTELDLDGIDNWLNNRCLLVTGSSGSIGR